MAFYAGAIVRDPAMENPTIVVLTDRNDLDDQLFGTFSRCRDLLRQTPTQASNRAVFGNYISIYDIQRSVEDGATVPIYYESRLARLSLDEDEKPTVDPEFEEATEGEEVERKEKLKTRWAQLEAIVGTEKRLRLLAGDMVAHFEERLEVMDGKAMVVCMSRRICIGLYRELVRLRPEWHDEDDGKGKIKVVMTGSASDPGDWQPHIRNKPRREALAQRFRDASDSLNIVLVRDMWLTGFDAPSLHTMYVDKPMRGHGLMQAIARVNRVFKDKPGVWWSIIWGLPTNSSTHWRPILRVGVRGRLRSIRKKRWWCCGKNTRFVVVCFTVLVGPNGLLVRLRRSWVCCQRHRSIFWRRGMVRTAVCRWCANYRRLLHWPCRTKKHGVSAFGR